MSKYKITVIENNTGMIVSEISEFPSFPMISEFGHSLMCGVYGIPVKVELMMDALEINQHDTTTATTGTL